MRRLKVCPVCLGDVIVEATFEDVESRCAMCGYRMPAKARPAGLARNQSPGSTTAAQRRGPQASRHLRSGRV